MIPRAGAGRHQTDTVEASRRPGNNTRASQSAQSKGTRIGALAAALALRDRDQVLLVIVCVLALLSIIAYWGRTSHWGADSIELGRNPARQLDYRIELNSASWVEWSQIPGIGPVLGERIVCEREQNGPFRDPSDLMRVKGIGPKRLSEIQPYIQMKLESSAP
jgi:competence protein ComEA